MNKPLSTMSAHKISSLAIAGAMAFTGVGAMTVGAAPAGAAPTEAAAAECPSSDHLKLRDDDESKGIESAEEAQCRLNAAGYKVSVDGRFGESSVKALKEFQKANKLKADGVLGQEAWKKLVTETGGQWNPDERAQAVIDYTEAQRGKPYDLGASGPDAFDCSGLTMKAFATVDVILDHKGKRQPGQLGKVDASDRKPGDLISWSSHRGHVGVYVGDGQMIDAGDKAGGVTRRAPDIYSGTEYYRDVG